MRLDELFYAHKMSLTLNVGLMTQLSVYANVLMVGVSLSTSGTYHIMVLPVGSVTLSS
jgi:hypothetical protein